MGVGPYPHAPAGHAHRQRHDIQLRTPPLDALGPCAGLLPPSEAKTPTNRATTTTAGVPSDASGIITPVSEPHSTNRHELGLSLPPAKNKQRRRSSRMTHPTLESSRSCKPCSSLFRLAPPRPQRCRSLQGGRAASVRCAHGRSSWRKRVGGIGRGSTCGVQRGRRALLLSRGDRAGEEEEAEFDWFCH